MGPPDQLKLSKKKKNNIISENKELFESPIECCVKRKT